MFLIDFSFKEVARYFSEFGVGLDGTNSEDVNITVGETSESIRGLVGNFFVSVEIISADQVSVGVVSEDGEVIFSEIVNLGLQAL